MLIVEQPWCSFLSDILRVSSSSKFREAIEHHVTVCNYSPPIPIALYKISSISSLLHPINSLSPHDMYVFVLFAFLPSSFSLLEMNPLKLKVHLVMEIKSLICSICPFHLPCFPFSFLSSGIDPLGSDRSFPGHPSTRVPLPFGGVRKIKGSDVPPLELQ